MAISGSYADPTKLGEVLQRAAKEYHLVAPAPSCGTLPEGCEVALSSVLVDVAAETYPVAGGGGGDDEGGGGGKRGLSKSALDRLAAAAGVSWDPVQSRRLDDGSHPHYCLFKSVGHVRQFDGSTVTIVATKEMDMREGSAQCEALRTRWRNKHERWERGGRRGYEPRPPDAQINEMRLHLVGHAESKARNRAIRSLGVRTSYTAAELAKPFVVARLMFTGQTSDPELRRAFALKRADAMLAGVAALYGPPAERAPSMMLASPVPPPALGAPREPDEDEELPDEPPPPPAAVETPAPPAPVAAAPPASAAPEAFTIPSGDEKGRPLAEATDGALQQLLLRVEGALERGEVRDEARAARAERFRAAIRAELEERAIGARETSA
jgi:hypothetical protein